MPLNGCGPGPGADSNTSASWSKNGSSLRISSCSSIGSSSSSQPAEDPVGEGVSGRTWENWISGVSAIVAGAPKAQKARRLKTVMARIVKNHQVQQPPDTTRCSQLQEHHYSKYQERWEREEREREQTHLACSWLNTWSNKQVCTDKRTLQGQRSCSQRLHCRKSAITDACKEEPPFNATAGGEGGERRQTRLSLLDRGHCLLLHWALSLIARGYSIVTIATATHFTAGLYTMYNNEGSTRLRVVRAYDT